VCGSRHTRIMRGCGRGRTRALPAWLQAQLRAQRLASSGTPRHIVCVERVVAPAPSHNAVDPGPHARPAHALPSRAPLTMLWIQVPTPHHALPGMAVLGRQACDEMAKRLAWLTVCVQMKEIVRAKNGLFEGGEAVTIT